MIINAFSVAHVFFLVFVLDKSKLDQTNLFVKETNLFVQETGDRCVFSVKDLPKVGGFYWWCVLWLMFGSF